ncbi:fluoride efflux transporter CrcB [Parvibaculum sp.]|jgi:CrcB protein|uniref:fluoride efflux transporter CrcB n=1 Tax=Parvibaculum sp. TaxID=2024848 RepID=UPI000C42F1B0|nr:fluoride efflux transporter CrcB [Parvibaculum sp.]MAU59270.1 fluoride efflux transporter CrcB [Parvibaculum sp.]MBO6669670.1 fluoride efflux transporter CrcB [Parvibaculum sp.]MBO6692691.1 fluoride efflux transporter CrcB [Parvibaculum sp.]MBO6716194.1 fluoride efflux transporter CrcB [Parvibaculum sp.]|tara:strand:+ start:37 stop:420 length:384 start_codon:yes stop_codon:yes gene_type:complete
MNAIFAVAVGGAIGATGRYLFNLQMLRLLGPNFPWGTFGVNVIGSFIMGLVAGLFALRFDVSPEMRSFITTGILGGFTTFSAFSLDAANMIERGQTGLAALYIGGSVVLGLAGLFFGLWIARAMFPA